MFEQEHMKALSQVHYQNVDCFMIRVWSLVCRASHITHWARAGLTHTFKGSHTGSSCKKRFTK